MLICKSIISFMMWNPASDEKEQWDRGCVVSPHQDEAAGRSPAPWDEHATLHMKGPQSATVSNGNGTFL